MLPEMQEPLLRVSPRPGINREPPLLQIPEDRPLPGNGNSLEGMSLPSPSTPRGTRPRSKNRWVRAFRALAGKPCDVCSGRTDDLESSLGQPLRDDHDGTGVGSSLGDGSQEDDIFLRLGEAMGLPYRKKCLNRANTCPDGVLHSVGTSRKEISSRPNLQTASSVVLQASMGLLIYLAVGIAIFVWKEAEFSGPTTVSFVDALYFCVVTMCTIGYGDIVPLTNTAKLFACLFVIFGVAFLDTLLSGLVTFVLNKQETLLLSAVEGGHHETARNYVMNKKEGRVRIRMKVGLAIGTVCLCVAVGTLVMHKMERLNWIDAFYGTMMSVTTVGYGDHTFKTMGGRLFAAVWLLVSTLAVARAFVFLAEARVDKRHRKIAKWVMSREITRNDVLAADLDRDGRISKSEFVIYKLKELGKVSPKEIDDLCHQFDRVDVEHTGKIHLTSLV